MKLRLFYFTAFISFIVLATSCTKDDDDNNNNNNQGGSDDDTIDSFISVNIEGDESGEFSSDANSALQGSPENGYQFIISRGPDDAMDDQSFAIFLQSDYSEIPQTIPTGTFDLTSFEDQQQDDGKYAISFTNFLTGTSFGYEVNGTVEITESNEDYLTGDFSFTTTSYTNGEEEIDVDGSFLVPRN